MEAEPGERHDEAAELGHDVRTVGQRADGARPRGEDVRPPPLVGPDAERTAEVVEDDRGVGKRPGEVGQLGKLGVVEPGIEREAGRRQPGEAAAKPRVAQQSGWRIRVGVADGLAGIPAGGVADAAEARARRQVGVEDLANTVAEAEIGEAHDAGGHARRAVAAAGAHGGDAIDELRLADRLQCGRPVGAVHRQALHEHRGAHVVAAAGVAQQLVEEIAPARMIPQVMVRIADRQRGLENLLQRGQAHGRAGRAPACTAGLPRFQATLCCTRAMRQPCGVRISPWV